MPFQFIRATNPTVAYTNNKSSLQGFIIRVSNVLLSFLAQNKSSIKLYPQLYLNIRRDTTNKADTLVWNGGARITSYVLNCANQKPLYFVPSGNDLDPISSIRMPYNSITTELYDMSSGNLSNYKNVNTGNGYIYLDKISPTFVSEASGVDKSQFTYFSNVFFN